MTRIIICDDHKIVREGLKQIVGVFPEFDVVGEAESAETLLQVLRKNETELLILDVSLPGRSGLEVIKQIRASYPEIRVLVLSMFPEDQFAIRMLKAGASGYLHKDSAPDVLHEALTTIAQGGEYLSPTISQLLYRQMHSNASELPHTTLSDREFEVMLYIGEGKSISDIARQLSLSVKTISTYRSRILEKMALDNNSDLVKYIMIHELAYNN